MENKFRPNMDEYELIYGALPDTRGELVAHLKKTLRLDSNVIKIEEERIKNIEWMEKEFIFFLIPKATPRPRMNGTHFYVKDAEQLHRVFKKYLRDEGIICTRIEYELTTYQPTPINSMTKLEILLAEKGLIRPIVTPDWDNLAKTYTDCLQSIMVLNDNIINPGKVEKYYSIKPRIHIKLRWMKDFDSAFNKKKTESSISYKKLFNKG